MRTTLIEQRKKKNLTQSAVATLLGISEIYVRKLENGDRNPSITMMLKFEKFYCVSMKELFPDIFFVTNDTICTKNLA
ncbi:helix-turn-helix transcriptional regulator [Metasolibacillus sp.]|uniref:helix-turn-helix transcriptional regulator n=1 Tax=Metasolibacillus sp. TaxID=2703680 RepID=UPI0025FD343A|nr:helix-turn-helix transcriptional regulator [Metasolibacillus sp.]MCT6925859.1 helix-turn-helix transcriptional regulator [Metasolibacillus sp.]MCT6942016.1 helix-turn-helix transcriptional regulator [Metasolibacillus sp.]